MTKIKKIQVKYKRRHLDGVLLFDKPSDMTSNQALQRIKHRFNAKKAGHSGTLDPMATGLLPISFGEATKFSTQLLNADKTYEFTCQLGAQTHTGDMEGTLIASAAIPQLSLDLIESVFAQFRGQILQIPPMVSALWHEGRRLYTLAREGIEIQREPRPITIFSLTLLGFDHTTFSAQVTCSKGTYVRVLAEDIAIKLGTLGHLIKLRRTAIYPFHQPKMLTFAQIMDEDKTLEMLDSHLLPTDIAILDLPEFILNDTLALKFNGGERVLVETTLIHSLYRVYNAQALFLGTGIPCPCGSNLLGPKRMRAVTNQVNIINQNSTTQ